METLGPAGSLSVLFSGSKLEWTHILASSIYCSHPTRSLSRHLSTDPTSLSISDLVPNTITHPSPAVLSTPQKLTSTHKDRRSFCVSRSHVLTRLSVVRVCHCGIWFSCLSLLSFFLSLIWLTLGVGEVRFVSEVRVGSELRWVDG